MEFARIAHEPAQAPRRDASNVVSIRARDQSRTRRRRAVLCQGISTSTEPRFAWPDPDIRPTASGEYLYGYLPEKLMRLVLEQVKKISVKISPTKKKPELLTSRSCKELV
jgi:hypothetical protein